MERKGQGRIDINDADAFNMVCEDILNDWIEDFPDREGLTREPTFEDREDFGCMCESAEDCDCIGFMYSQAGMILYYRAIDKLKALGMKYFEESDLEISASNMIFP